jgi:hypothetical protein
VRIAAARGGRRHPLHVAMGAFGQELVQPLRRLRDRIRPRDADHVEAMVARGLHERRLERCAIAQKSRSE